jgi:hypothetical protein
MAFDSTQFQRFADMFRYPFSSSSSSEPPLPPPPAVPPVAPPTATPATQPPATPEPSVPETAEPDNPHFIPIRYSESNISDGMKAYRSMYERVNLSRYYISPVATEDYWRTYVRQAQKSLDENLPEKIITEALGGHKTFFDDLNSFGNILRGGSDDHFWKNASNGFEELKKILDKKLEDFVRTSGLGNTTLIPIKMTILHRRELSRFLISALKTALKRKIIETIDKYHVRPGAEITLTSTTSSTASTSEPKRSWSGTPLEDDQIGLNDAAFVYMMDRFRNTWVYDILDVIEDPLKKRENTSPLTEAFFPPATLSFFKSDSDIFDISDIIVRIFMESVFSEITSNVTPIINIDHVIEKMLRYIPNFLVMMVKSLELVNEQYSEFLSELNKGEISIVSGILNNTTLSDEDAILNQFVNSKYISMISKGMLYFQGMTVPQLISSSRKDIQAAFAEVCKLAYAHSMALSAQNKGKSADIMGQLRVMVNHLRGLLNGRGRTQRHSDPTSYSELYERASTSKRSRALLYEKMVERMGSGYN